MSGTTFDLVATISDLLKKIDAGRKAFRETQKVRDDFQTTCVNRDKAGEVATKLQHKMLSLDEPERSRAHAEFDRQMAEFHRLVEESNRQWPLFKETTAFIDPFHKDVLLFLQRLPLEPKWKEYRQAVERLGIGDHGCWADPPANPALDLLERRLREMLEPAGRTQPGQVPNERALPRSGEHRLDRTNNKHRSRNPETDRIVNRVREVYKEAARQDEMPTSAVICQQIDARKIPLPQSTTWGREWSSWREAFAKNDGAVSTWLSRAKHSSK